MEKALNVVKGASMKKERNEFWIVVSTWHTDDGVEFNISQEGYYNFEDAKRFCESRHNGEVYDIDQFTYVSEPDSKGRYYEYKILNIVVK